MGTLIYLGLGVLFQYIFYGNAPLDLVALLHIVFWIFILLWWIVWWIMAIALIAVVIGVTLAFMGYLPTVMTNIGLRFKIWRQKRTMRRAKAILRKSDNA